MPHINKAVPRDQLLDPEIGREAIRKRGARLEEQVRPLTEWVRNCRSDSRLPSGAGATVPWFDPVSGGVHSRVLLLLLDPSRTAATGTGFISPDNNDPTARNTRTLRIRRTGAREPTSLECLSVVGEHA
jgi:hypothetical protein